MKEIEMAMLESKRNSTLQSNTSLLKSSVDKA
jgi:hypothetical protein